MVMRPTKLARTPPTSRGNSPARNGGKQTTPTRKKPSPSPTKAKASPIRASPIKASPVRTPPDFEFIIRNSSKKRQLVKSSSNRSSRGTSPAKSENSFILHSRGSE